jgi:flagellar biosynthesis regulator FlaF
LFKFDYFDIKDLHVCIMNKYTKVIFDRAIEKLGDSRKTEIEKTLREIYDEFEACEMSSSNRKND